MAKSLDALVHSQFRRWETLRRSDATERPQPCLAISRQHGAGGASLGRLVAERLGYGFFGREIVEEITKRTGLSHQLVVGVDEHIRGSIDRFLGDGFRQQRFTESEYLRQVVRVIATLGERGGAVILGRGAPFILKPERALRVLLVAPRQQRLEHLAKSLELAAKEAEARLVQLDQRRAEFLRHDFGRDPDDPINYDLTLNTGSLELGVSAELLVSALRIRFSSEAAVQSPS
jgi:cytidylate kinase